MPQVPQSTIPRSSENSYGGQKVHHPEHDMNIQKNFTNDNLDFQANGAEYNDFQEPKFNTEDRLAVDHHDRPEPENKNRELKPSNYSDGGHGRHTTKPLQERGENADNKDYKMNKDSEQGAKQAYDNTDEKTPSSVDANSTPANNP